MRRGRNSRGIALSAVREDAGMDDLLQWLGAQLAEDERIARAAGDRFGFAWTANGDVVSSEIDYVSVVEEPASPTAFIATHDPARVLREIDSKRAILALHTQSLRDGGCQVCDVPSGRRLQPDACTTVRMLASVYTDRPGYREEWRP